MHVLDQALAAGATIVTPNNRLARHVAARFDAARRAAGARAWTAAAVMPWSLWLERRWHAALAARAEAAPRALLDRSITRELWHAIVARDQPDLLDTRGAATRAAAAWTLFHAWRAPDDDIETLATGARHGDAQAFGRWARRACRLRATAASSCTAFSISRRSSDGSSTRCTTRASRSRKCRRSRPNRA